MSEDSKDIEYGKRHNGRRGKWNLALIDPHKALENAGIKEGDILVDAACGEGRFTFEASKLVGDSGSIYAVDISEEAIEILRQKATENELTNIQTFISDIDHSIPLKDNLADVCLLANIVHGLNAHDKIDGTLKETFRILKPGGTLIIIDFKKISGPPGPPIDIRLTPDEMAELVSEYGFKSQKTKVVGDYHYRILFTKESNT